MILLCFAIAGSCVERRAPGLCSWSTLANTDRCTLYYNVSVLRVRFRHACLLFYILNFSPQHQRYLPHLQPRVASTLMILEPSLKKETSLKVFVRRPLIALMTHAATDLFIADHAQRVVPLLYHKCCCRRISDLLWRSAAALVQGALSQRAVLHLDNISRLVFESVADHNRCNLWPNLGSAFSSSYDSHQRRCRP